MDMEYIEYDKDKMLRFVKKDMLLERMYSDLGENDNTLIVLFNSEVLGDSAMIQDYMNA